MVGCTLFDDVGITTLAMGGWVYEAVHGQTKMARVDQTESTGCRELSSAAFKTDSKISQLVL